MTDFSAEDSEAKTFSDFGVDPRIVSALEQKGIVHPFPIQALTLPVALKRHDIIGQAKTGTGKTLGFGLPILCDVATRDQHPGDFPIACVIAPTRELALQVADDLRQAGSLIGARVATIFGGRTMDQQIDALQSGCDIAVGTPGRMLDLLKRKVLHLENVRTLVLDEADEMLDLGFLPDIEHLVKAIPTDRHTMLFSATMPAPIMALARNYMTQPTHIRASDPNDDSITVDAIRQVAYRCHELNKDEVLARILQARDRGLTIVFSQTKRVAQKVNDELLRRGFACATIHGDLQQRTREKALSALRDGRIDVLVATDVAARGIDVDDVTHVINYQCPEDAKTYVHRIGRTGRAGHTGTAITFVDWEDTLRWRLVVKELGLDPSLREPAETYHTSAHLFTDLDFPEGAGPILPEEKRTRQGISQRAAARGSASSVSSGKSSRGGRKRRRGFDSHSGAGERSTAGRNRSQRQVREDSGTQTKKTTRRRVNRSTQRRDG